MAAVAAFALVVGFLAQRVLAKAIIEPIKLAVGQFEKISTGDLTGTVVVPGENEMAYLLHALKRMQDGLVDTVNQVRTSTETIVGDVRTIASGNVDLSARTEQQAVSLQQAAASVEQLTAAVRQNADNARDARTYVEGAAGIARRRGDAARGRDDVGDFAQFHADLRDRRRDRKHRIPDQHPCIERCRRSRARRRAGARLRGRRDGSALRAALRVSGEGDPRTDRPFRAACRGRQRPRRTGRFGDGRLVAAVERVNMIMSETGQAFEEQASGIEQVNAAVIQMEQTMQRNAALVEGPRPPRCRSTNRARD